MLQVKPLLHLPLLLTGHLPLLLTGPAVCSMYVALDAERNTAQLDTDDPITSPWTTNWTIAAGRLETPKLQQSTLKVQR